MTATSASIVICAHTMDRWEVLSRSVRACKAQSLPPEEVILVVDRNEELLARARAELPVDRVIANKHPAAGASGGRTTGTEIASAPVVVFLDDDAVPEPLWLEELLAPLADPNAVGVGGAVEPAWVGEPATWLPPEFYWVIGCTWAGMGILDGRIRNPIAANMAIRKELLLSSGGFPAALGRSGSGTKLSGTAEETELAIRVAARAPGGYWAYSEAARVHHQVTPQRGTWRYFVDRCVLEGRAKAVVATLAGRAGLSSEATYTIAVLPRALFRNLLAAARGDSDGLRRAGGIIAGFSITAAAYLWASLRLRLGLPAFASRAE